MKTILLLLVCFAATMQLCSSKAFNELEKSPLIDLDHLLSGQALADSKHNLTLGHRQPGDRLLTWDQVQHEDGISVDGRISATYNYTMASPGYITCVEVEDVSCFGKGGYASLVSGGPGHRHLTLGFIGEQINEPLNFDISIFGKRP